MLPRICALCENVEAMLKRPKTSGYGICHECFFCVFETEVHNTTGCEEHIDRAYVLWQTK